MKLINKICRYGMLIFILLGCIDNASSQAIRRIVDPEQSPLDGVVVNVLSPVDSIWVCSSITDAGGHFNISDTIPRDYMLITDLYGYERYTELIGNLPDTIILTPNVKELREVTVIGNKDLFKQEGGKFIFTPAKLKTEVSTAYELLPYVPLVSLDKNNILEIVGKSSCVIYVNGEDLHIPQEQLLAELKTLPPDYIKSIEVIVATGGEFSASTKTGVINIILTDRNNGFKGNLSADGNIGQGSKGNNDNIILTFAKRKFRASFYSYFYLNNSDRSTNTIYNYAPENPNGLVIENKEEKNGTKSSWSNDINFSYDITRQNTLFAGFGLVCDREKTIYNSSSITHSPDGSVTESNGLSIYHKPWDKPKAIYGTLYYTSKLDGKGSKVEGGVYLRKGSGYNTTETNFNNIPNTERRDKNKGLTGVVSYTGIFSDKHNLKAGYRVDLAKLSNNEYSDIQNYCFDYSEDIHALYFHWNSRWNDILSSSIGLRAEYSRTKGNMIERSLFDRKETGLFPSLSVSWNTRDYNHSVSLSIDRYISRPQYSDLNPYPIWTSDNTYIVGNPELKSSKTWDLSLYYMLKGQLIFNVRYSDASPQGYTVNYGVDGKTFMTRLNAGVARIIFATVEYNKVFWDIWRFRARAYYSHDYRNFDIKDYAVTENYSRVGIDLYNTITFANKRIPKIDFFFQSGYWGNSLSFGTYPFVDMSLSLRKEIFSGFSTQIGVHYGLGNIFTRKYSDSNYSYERKNSYSPVAVNLGLTYTFGKRQIRDADDSSGNVTNGRFK